MLDLKLEGFEPLQARLRTFPEALRKNYMRNGMRALVAYMRKGARQRIRSRTGGLKRSVGISTRAFSDGTVIGKVFTGAVNAGKLKGGDAWYGHIVEGGAKPHAIRPKNAKALRIGGRFFRSVKHPGMKAQHFMLRTAQQDFNHGSQLFKDYVETNAKAHLEGTAR